jgi:cation diffusion facilitator family transporter
MKDCCEGKAAALAALREKQGHVLKVVLGLNAAMFLVEITMGIVGRSTSLVADSLDMFGDAVVYAVSLYALHRSEAWKARVSLLKGSLMALLAVGALFEAARKALVGAAPEAPTMGLVGLLALAVNVACLLLLLRHRSDDINMSSAWVCSRNDIVSNVGVLIAAGAVSVSGSKWPDVVIGSGIALYVLASALAVFRGARRVLHGDASPAGL